MGTQTIITCLLLSLVEGMTRINDEFNTKLYDEDMEYDLIDNENFKDGTEHFYRQIRSLEEDYRNVETVDTQEYYRRLPISDFARKLREINDENANEEYEQRFRRSTQGDDDRDKKDLQRLVDNGEKPLEVLVLDLSKNDTKYGSNPKDFDQLNLNTGEDESLKINDFIRFKRDLSNTTKLTDDDKSRSKRERDENGAKREAGFKEQWVKQPYPVGGRNIERPSEEIFRSPRVNFVTQRRSESAPYPVYYDSNYRYRDFADDYENYSRFPRHYQSDPYRRNYYRDETPRYPAPPPSYNANYYDTRPVYKQRRIIYYATLPEIVRNPNGDLGDRYNYRDFYESDSRYGGVPSQNVGRGDPYRFRKPYPLDKSRYDEGGPVKGAYPLKVSTDVNVKEIKKSPERRIFSEGDQRYGRGPYQPLERY